MGMAWTGVQGLAVGSVPAYASVHGSKLYVFPVQRHFCIFTESLPYTHIMTQNFLQYSTNAVFPWDRFLVTAHDHSYGEASDDQ
jgi:hypothetical protein